MIWLGNSVIRKSFTKRMLDFYVANCRYNILEPPINICLLFFEEMDFLNAEIKSVINGRDNTLELPSLLSDTRTFQITNSKTKSYLVPVIDSPSIRRKPDRKGHKNVSGKSSLKEITKAMRNLEKETKKKLKELEVRNELLTIEGQPAKLANLFLDSISDFDGAIFEHEGRQRIFR